MKLAARSRCAVVRRDAPRSPIRPTSRCRAQPTIRRPTPRRPTPADETAPPATPRRRAAPASQAARMTTPQPHVARPRARRRTTARAGSTRRRTPSPAASTGGSRRAQGAVHVWVPAGYDRETAGTVIYVHGYWTDADGAWRDHELARQFKASHQNAMFIVPDAPAVERRQRQVARAQGSAPRRDAREPPPARRSDDRDGPLGRVPHDHAVGRSPPRRADHPARRDVRRRGARSTSTSATASAPTSTS